MYGIMYGIMVGFDLNPSIDKTGLALNIDMNNNMFDYDLAKTVVDFFKLKVKQMDQIITEILDSVIQWGNDS